MKKNTTELISCQSRKILSTVLSLTLIASSCIYAENISLNPEVRVPELRPVALSQENITELESYDKSTELLSNVQYIDVLDDTNKEDIYQLAAEGVLKKYGVDSFYPGIYATKQDV